jgi:NADPH2:quinone reductase
MKIVSFQKPGGPEVLEISESEIPALRKNEILIEVYAAGVNRPDIAQREGSYPPPADASPILGLEVSGVVHKVSENSRWKVGDKVCALVPGGGYAEFCTVPESHCLPIPNGLSFEEAAGIPENYFTVWSNVFMVAQLQPNENFLVHGGTSGIGTTAIQLAKNFGAKVYTTAGSKVKCDATLLLGATEAINYKEKDFAAEFKSMNVILDMVGGEYTPKNIECLAPHGRIVQIATMKAGETTIDLRKVMTKRAVLTGSTLRPRTIEEKAAIARELYQHVWPLFESKKIKVLIDKIYPFAEVKKAHEHIESSQHIGKIILKIHA